MWGPLDVQAVKLPIEAYSPGARDFVLKNYFAEADKKHEQAAAAVKAAKERQDPAALKVAEASFGVAAQQRYVLKARWQADQAERESPGDSLDWAKYAAYAEKKLAALQAEEAVAKAEVDVSRSDGTKRLDNEKKLDVAKATLLKSMEAIKNAGTTYTPLRGALKTLESNVETDASRNKPFPKTSTGRRSALAAWLTDRKNPLTARVAVNHIWARHFGTPLVATVFDFGRKGAAPTHPELLDSLAVDFMEHGWSMKRVHRLIVTSAAYRMSSSAADADAKTLAADPENRYYWRRNAPRMEAQLIRDSLLQLADQLDPKIGGPPVPIAQELSPRRSLYFVHSNNDNQKFLSQFDDASVRECYRRSESIVPQQALALANSKLTLTMTAKITERLQKKLATAPDADFVRTAFQLVLGCDPTAQEITECTAALAEWRTLAAKRPDAAVRARNNLVHALINHNDFITIR
jgi:hypothetical protein